MTILHRLTRDPNRTVCGMSFGYFIDTERGMRKVYTEPAGHTLDITRSGIEACKECFSKNV